jgi:Family of unknown function (DUF6161)
MTEEVFTFSLGPHGDATVSGWDGLERWIQSERAHWTWLVRSDPKTDAHNWASSVQSAWDNTLQGVKNIRAGGQPVSEAKRALAPLAGGLLIASDSEEGALVLGIRETAGDMAASFAYAFIKGGVQPNSMRNRDEFLGAILTSIPDIREPTEISARLQRERGNYRNSIKSAIVRLDNDNSKRRVNFEEEIVRGKRIASKLLRRRRDKWKSVQSAWQVQASDAVASIRAVEAAYVEAMRLQAPVKYWSDKAKDHKTRENWAIGRLALFFPLAFFALGLAFLDSSTYLLEHTSKPGSTTPVALYVIITGGLAVLSTMLFWIGRLLTKLYLSEHHLRNDADERAIMTQTYLALTRDAAASDTDRNIILSALFRSTPDGIVKDDGPADFSIQSLLSRLATR